MSYLAYMGPDQLERAIAERWPVVVPAGCIEFHGSHLPFGTDLILVEEIVKRVEPHANIVVAPAIAYGPTGYAVGGPKTGTIDIHAGVFKDYVKEILYSLYRMGFRRFVAIVHHQGPEGPEGVAFRMAAAEIFNELHRERGEGWYSDPVTHAVCGDWLMDVRVMGLTVGPSPWPGGHGGISETEPMLALRPDAVRMSLLRRDDYPWNWAPGNEADQADGARGERWIEGIVQDWIAFFEESGGKRDDE